LTAKAESTTTLGSAISPRGRNAELSPIAGTENIVLTKKSYGFATVPKTERIKLSVA